MKRRLERFLNSGEKGVFLYTGIRDKNNRKSLLFTDPVKEITCIKPSALNSKIKLIEKYINKGYYAAGYISYEAGYFLEKKLAAKGRREGRLLYFGIFRKPRKITGPLPGEGGGYFRVSSVKNSISYKTYLKNFRVVKDNIRNGEVYQINYCFSKKFGFEGSCPALFRALAANQNVSYAAYIKDGKNTVISLSPELFFRINGREIEMRPMKGTVLKNSGFQGPSSELNTKKMRKQLMSEKNRAENLMIVDLIRNDLGRICETNSVRVPELFRTEEYETLFQMTSVIKGKLLKNKGFSGIIRAVFPSGSVTGAPKIRAMEIIRKIEGDARGIYTGALGYASGKKSVFNIPIRTVEISGNKGRIGIGSGLVADSRPASEYAESAGKARFFEAAPVNFGLIESILLNNGRYYLKSLHAGRIKKSSEFFGIRFSRREFEAGLERTRKKHPAGRFKARVVLSPGGDMAFYAQKIRAARGNKGMRRICVWPGRVDRKDLLLRHKTTRRKFYDTALAWAKSRGYDDVIFRNRQGRVTEASSSNVFVKKGKRLITPPVSEGLLPGTLRESLTRSGRCRTGILAVRDLTGEAEVFLGNSVRGLVRAEVTPGMKKNYSKSKKKLD